MKYLVILIILLLPGFTRGQFLFSDSAVRARVFKDVHVLASDSFEGRRTGTPGGFRAAAYIADQFRNAGLKPYGDSSTFFQDFTIRSFSDNSESLFSLGRDTLIYKYDYSPVSFSVNGTFSGKIVPYNYSNTIDASGKGILFDLASQPDADSLQEIMEEVSVLQKTGAGIIILWDSRGDLHPELFRFDKDPDTTVGIVTFINIRTAKMIIGGNDSANIILSKGKAGYFKGRNVAGYIDNGAVTTVIFGGHYDHMGKENDKIKYGADDNASGAAAVMEMARYMSLNGNTCSNYLFIAFDAEELWLLGSAHFAGNSMPDPDKINFMFNFDMVGRLGCEGNKVTVIASASSPWWDDIYKSAPHDFRLGWVRGAAAYSDHYPFYKKGIPVAYITTGIHDDYHTETDTPDKINYDGMVKVIKYSEDVTNLTAAYGKLPYRKVPGWIRFWSQMYYISEQMNQMLTIKL